MSNRSNNLTPSSDDRCAFYHFFSLHAWARCCLKRFGESKRRDLKANYGLLLFLQKEIMASPIIATIANRGVIMVCSDFVGPEILYRRRRKPADVAVTHQQ